MMSICHTQVELVILPRSIINENPQEQQNQPPPPPPPPQNQESEDDQNPEEDQEVIKKNYLLEFLLIFCVTFAILIVYSFPF